LEEIIIFLAQLVIVPSFTVFEGPYRGMAGKLWLSMVKSIQVVLPCLLDHTFCTSPVIYLHLLLPGAERNTHTGILNIQK